MILLLFALTCCDDAAQAGAAYRDAQEALRAGRYDEAVAKLQEAIRFEPRETDKLMYRDRDGRHREAYYPHYVWSQARTQQAQAESNPDRRRTLLREALTHLDLTEHPSASSLSESVKKDLATAEKLASGPTAADAALQELRGKVLTLCDQERFDEARRTLAGEAGLLDRSPAERATLQETIDNRRRSTLTRYDHAMNLALETVASSPLSGKPDSLLPLLEPALVPPAVMEKPDARFVWLRDFYSLVERELPTLRAGDQASSAAVLRCARAFEQSALPAFDAGSFPGYRAALNVADTIRSARIASLASGRDDPQLDPFLSDSEQVLQRRETFLSRGSGPADEVRKYQTGVLAAGAAALRRVRERLDERRRLRSALDRWSSQGDRALLDPAVMGSPAALKAFAREGAPLENSTAWGELPPGLKAKVLFSRAILDLVAGILEGEAAGPIRERISPLIRSARTLDPEVEATWKERLSPKIRAWLAEVDH